MERESAQSAKKDRRLSQRIIEGKLPPALLMGLSGTVLTPLTGIIPTHADLTVADVITELAIRPHVRKLRQRKK